MAMGAWISRSYQVFVRRRCGRTLSTQFLGPRRSGADGLEESVEGVSDKTTWKMVVQLRILGNGGSVYANGCKNMPLHTRRRPRPVAPSSPRPLLPADIQYPFEAVETHQPLAPLLPPFIITSLLPFCHSTYASWKPPHCLLPCMSDDLP